MLLLLHACSLAATRRAILSLLGAAVLAAAPAAAQEGGFRHLFFDDEDGQLDVSNFLARGGFIPLPIIITEPAVDDGLGLAAYFVGAKHVDHIPPTRTIVAGLKTGNGSEGFGAFRSGSFGGGRFLYTAAAGTGLGVADFYPGNRDYSFTYTGDFDFALASVRYRFGDTGFSIGPSLRYVDVELSLDAGDAFPELTELAGKQLTLPSVGFGVHYDTRDNPLTPTKGVNVIAETNVFDEAVGSDIDFSTASLFGAWFGAHDRWRLGAMGSIKSSSNSTPFFIKPAINIRGLSRNRYVGKETLSLEVEISRRIAERWSVLAFAGHGQTFGGGSADVTKDAFGVGFRYRIARKLGLDVGIDYAWGPDEDVFYLQFGHAWGAQMD